MDTNLLAPIPAGVVVLAIPIGVRRAKVRHSHGPGQIDSVRAERGEAAVFAEQRVPNVREG